MISKIVFPVWDVEVGDGGHDELTHGDRGGAVAHAVDQGVGIDAEWEVMVLVWNGSPVSANEVVEELAKRRRWKP